MPTLTHQSALRGGGDAKGSGGGGHFIGGFVNVGRQRARRPENVAWSLENARIILPDGKILKPNAVLSQNWETVPPGPVELTANHSRFIVLPFDLNRAEQFTMTFEDVASVGGNNISFSSVTFRKASGWALNWMP